MSSLIALRVVLDCMSEDDYLYKAPPAGGEFSPVDYGRSPEFYCLQSVVLERIWPIPSSYTTTTTTTMPIPRAFATVFTDAELEEMLE